MPRNKVRPPHIRGSLSEILGCTSCWTDRQTTTAKILRYFEIGLEIQFKSALAVTTLTEVIQATLTFVTRPLR